MQVAHTKLSTPLPQRTPFLPEQTAEVNLIITAAPKRAALLQETQNGQMRKWVDHRDSVTLYEEFNKVPFTQNFQFIDFLCDIFPEIMHFDDCPNKNN